MVTFLQPAFISMPGPMELVVIFAVLLLLFGAKRLPEIARGFGEAIREFKKSLTETPEDPGKNKDHESI